MNEIYQILLMAFPAQPVPPLNFLLIRHRVVCIVTVQKVKKAHFIVKMFYFRVSQAKSLSQNCQS